MSKKSTCTVAAYAKHIGWKMPTPPSDVEPGFFKLTHHQHLISRDTSIATPWVHGHERNQVDGLSTVQFRLTFTIH